MSYLHFIEALRDTFVSFAVSGGYFAIFLSVLGEGIPLLGMAVPGNLIVITAGFLSATGVLNIYIVFVIALIAALIGDYVSYLLGRRYGWNLIEKLRPYFFISDSIFIKTRMFLEAHMGKAIILGRFNPLTRGLMSFFVGANNLPHGKFWLWNSIGTALWVTFSISVGYLLGLGYSSVQSWASKALIVFVVTAVLIIWVYRFVNMRFHIFRKYELFVLGLALASAFVLFRMIEDSFVQVPYMASFDLYVNDFVNNYLLPHYGYWIAQVSAWFSALFGTKMIVLLTLLGSVLLLGCNKWRSSAVLILSVGFTGVSTLYLKEFISRIRPENYIADYSAPVIGFLFDHESIITEPSFPSGHASFAAAFLLVVTYLALPRIKSWVARESIIVGAVALGVIAGLARLITSVHWASDVIAGWALGIFCASLSILFVRYVSFLIDPAKILKQGITGHIFRSFSSK